MALMFGNEELITCIQHVEVTGGAGESLCLAYKISKLFIAGGVKLTDEGYVLGVEEGNATHVKVYYKLDAAELDRLQTAGLLARPLPAYSIPWYEYAIGHSLSLVIALMGLVALLGRWAKKRRLQRRAEEAASTPISYGPPAVETDGDRFIQEQVTPLLQSGETVQHQAYATDRVPDGSMMGAARAHAWFAVLTTRRLLLLETRVGAFGILFENRGCESIERSRIAGLTVDDSIIVVRIDDGSARTLVVMTTRKLSNQAAFLRDVPRILAPASALAVS